MKELRLRIDWSEQDLFGHINNVAFMKYIQASRVNYWEKVGIPSTKNVGVMLVSTACQFKKPLYYPGDIRIEASTNFVKNTSFGFHHIIYDDTNEVVAEADDVMVLYDFNKNEKMVISDDLRKLLV